VPNIANHNDFWVRGRVFGGFQSKKGKISNFLMLKSEILQIFSMRSVTFLLLILVLAIVLLAANAHLRVLAAGHHFEYLKFLQENANAVKPRILTSAIFYSLE
jgi:hypothetical protein